MGTEPIGLAIDNAHAITYVTNYGGGTVTYFKTP